LVAGAVLGGMILVVVIVCVAMERSSAYSEGQAYISLLLLLALAVILGRALRLAMAAERRNRSKSFACTNCGREAWTGTLNCPRCGALMPIEYVGGNLPGGFEVIQTHGSDRDLPLATLVEEEECAQSVTSGDSRAQIGSPSALSVGV
jgi:hypothetical protein